VIDEISLKDIQMFFKTDDIEANGICVWWGRTIPDEKGKRLKASEIYENLALRALLRGNSGGSATADVIE
jgi:hypothetical protein